MAVSRRPTPVNEIDLEQTAELPVIDLAAVTAKAPVLPEPDLGDVTIAVPTLDLDDTLARTDLFEAPTIDFGASRLSDNLRDVEDRLHRKSERLAKLEAELASLRAEHARYVQDAERITEDLSRQLAELREHSEHNLAATQDIADRELAALREEQASELAAVRAGSARELASARETAARELAGLRDAHAREQQGAKAELKQAHDALARVQEAHNAAEARAARAEQRIAEQERELQVRARRIEDLQGELTRSSGLVRELGEERDLLRANCERQLEALHRAEAYRGVIDGLMTEHDSALDVRAKEFEALAAQVSLLPQRDARIGELEGELASLRAQAAQHVQRISNLTIDAQGWEARLAELTTAMATAERSAHAQAEALQTAARRAEELQAARAMAEAALAEERAARESALARFSARDQDLLQLREAHAQRETDLASREATIDERERAASTLLDEQNELLQRLKVSVASAEERAARVEGDLQAAEEQLRQLETEKRRHDGRLEELLRGSDALQTRLADAERRFEERDLRVRRLEAEAHASAAVLGNLNQSIQRLREDTGTHQALAEPPLESMERLLIRVDGEQSVLYKVGRRTTIGRTPDNDIRLDANFVSRHHAVLLASARATLIEDLNSTNGVIVNGRRVTRQPLHDGDVVSIGTAEFRFELRPSGHVSASD